MKGDGGVAAEGRLVGVPKFHSWGKCTMPLRNTVVRVDGLAKFERTKPKPQSQLLLLALILQNLNQTAVHMNIIM